MQDRVPGRGKQGRIKLRHEATGQVEYAFIERADDPLVEGSPLNKNTLLRDATCENFGLPPKTTVPADLWELVYQWTRTHIGEVRWGTSNKWGSNWLLCNGSEVNASLYPQLAAQLDPQIVTYLPMSSMGNLNFECLKMIKTGNYYVAVGWGNTQENVRTTKTIPIYASESSADYWIYDNNEDYVNPNTPVDTFTYETKENAGLKVLCIAYATSINGPWTLKPIRVRRYNNNSTDPIRPNESCVDGGVKDFAYGNGGFGILMEGEGYHSGSSHYGSYAQTIVLSIPNLENIENPEANKLTYLADSHYYDLAVHSMTYAFGYWFVDTGDTGYTTGNRAYAFTDIHNPKDSLQVIAGGTIGTNMNGHWITTTMFYDKQNDKMIMFGHNSASGSSYTTTKCAVFGSASQLLGYSPEKIITIDETGSTVITPIRKIDDSGRYVIGGNNSSQYLLFDINSGIVGRGSGGFSSGLMARVSSYTISISTGGSRTVYYNKNTGISGWTSTTMSGTVGASIPVNYYWSKDEIGGNYFFKNSYTTGSYNYPALSNPLVGDHGVTGYAGTKIPSSYNTMQNLPTINSTDRGTVSFNVPGILDANILYKSYLPDLRGNDKKGYVNGYIKAKE